MSLEVFGYIKNLINTNPTGTDPKSEGDDHIRGIKQTLLNQFSGFTQGKAITVNEDTVNSIPNIQANTLLAAYPVGSVYISTLTTNPSSLFGGTWDRMPFGRFLLNEDGSGGYALGATGGSATHTLTIDEIPSHTHTITSSSSQNTSTLVNSKLSTADTPQTVTTNATGGGLAHNNMPPYVVVYMWKRTA